jgi:hypothetical protein
LGYTTEHDNRPWDPASHRIVWVRGDRVLVDGSSATTGNTTSSEDSFPNDDFFHGVDNLFGDMGYNLDENVDAPPVTCMLILSFLFEFFLWFFVLAYDQFRA